MFAICISSFVRVRLFNCLQLFRIEMAAIWIFYLSVGVILMISSNGALSYVSNSTTKNGYANAQVFDQDVRLTDNGPSKSSPAIITNIASTSTSTASERLPSRSTNVTIAKTQTNGSFTPHRPISNILSDGQHSFATTQSTVSLSEGKGNAYKGNVNSRSLGSSSSVTGTREQFPTTVSGANDSSWNDNRAFSSPQSMESFILNSNVTANKENDRVRETAVKSLPKDVSTSESAASSLVPISSSKASLSEYRSTTLPTSRDSFDYKPTTLNINASRNNGNDAHRLSSKKATLYYSESANSSAVDNRTSFSRSVVTSAPASSSNIYKVLSLPLSGTRPTTTSVSPTFGLPHTALRRRFTGPPNLSAILITSTSNVTAVVPTSASIENSDDNLSPDYMADVYDIFTEDYVANTLKKGPNGPGNTTTSVDIPSLRRKFIHAFTNLTSTEEPLTTDDSDTASIIAYNSSTSSAFVAASKSDDLPDSASGVEEVIMSTPADFNVSSVVSVTANGTRHLNKEQLQFPGITLKVSHVLIPKQKRSRYNIQNMRIELPKTENLSKSPPSVPKTSKNSNCTRFPVQVVTAADSESKEKVNLTEEHYDCEFSSEIQSTRQKEPLDSVRTYYGGYVFRYTIPKSSVNDSVMANHSATETTKLAAPTAFEDNDDYYSSYVEYSDPANATNNTAGIADNGLFPDPIIRNEKMSGMKTEAYSISLPETNLIDSDLHDHDVIDSVMYIYFGGTSRGQRGAGRQIIIVGAVIALVAQFLTLASSIRRIKTHQGEEPTIILLNVEIALTLTNLIFILGVQSTSSQLVCKITAVSLYYLHITTLFWFLLSSVYSVQIVCQFKKPLKFYIFCIFGWILPFIAALLAYIFNERSFETSSYCWVSPLRGILLSYILPVIFLCIICIVLTVYGLRRAADMTEDFDDTYSHRKLLRISAVALPLFSVIWFTGMVALENSSSLLFSMIFLISNTVLNWLLFGCWLPSEASQWKDMDEDYYDDEDDFDDEPVLAKRRFDDQPLLSELYEYGAQGQLYNLRIEPISVISAP